MLTDDLVMSEKPCLAQLIDVHARLGGNVVAVMEVPREKTNLYGVIDPGEPVADSDGKVVAVKGLVEKPQADAAPSNLAVIGRYILQPEISTSWRGWSKGPAGRYN